MQRAVHEEEPDDLDDDVEGVWDDDEDEDD